MVLDLECHVLLLNRASVVQPSGTARPALRGTVYARPGAVPSERDAVSEEEQPDGDPAVPPD